ncbi:uncharacterized protein P884DRAFT_191527 [Thermothelomyces heterothallicus CBS 202.75]|uniref:uncharacterized protein n=1 Tax=Thermothelomyces heterothallicus CBS 202.75 TaxID=1149848 RepID=UPI0037425F39
MISTNCRAAVDVQDALVPSGALVIDQDANKTTLDPGSTLLPGPVASLVSFATRSTCLAVRITSAIGGSGLDAARFTTLSTLKVGRTILDGVLSRAGKDAALVRAGAVQADTETGIEGVIEKIHNKADLLIFWTATGFQFANTALSTLSEGSQLFLSTLDRFFGSTDSSRAMASIIAMIRREIANPPLAGRGEMVGVSDLVAALCTLAFLQRSCRSLLEEEDRRSPVDEVVWDIVVLNDGVRVDISDKKLRHRLSRSLGSSEHRDLSLDSAPARQLERDIVQSLPNNAKVSITTELAVSETITVDFTGDVRQIEVRPPPGIELIEEKRNNALAQAGKENATVQFVFRNARRHERRVSYQKTDGEISHAVDSGRQLEPPASHYPVSKVASRQKSYHEGENITTAGPSTSPTSSHHMTTPRLCIDLDADSSVQQEPSHPTYAAPPSQSRGSQPSLLADKKLPELPLVPTRREEHSSGPSAGETRKGPRNVLRRSTPRLNKKDNSSEAASGKAKSTFVASLAAKLSGKSDRRPASIHQQSLFLDSDGGHDEFDHSLSRISYHSIQESRRQSTVSLGASIVTTDNYQSTSMYAETAGSREVCELDPDTEDEGGQVALARNHRRSKSDTPSIRTLATSRSEMSLFSSYQSTALTFTPVDKLSALRQSGVLPGVFPERHLLSNAARYMRFASASYGSHFLRALGIGTEMPRSGILDDTHHELRSFAHHTKSNPNDILLASFVDPEGGSDATGATNTGVPLVHYISLDHESKAVVLACRGTLGFEDVLADMACEYDELTWQGRSYKVHKGVHASAKRLLHGGDGRVLRTLQAALEEFPNYGLILTGHSLGAAVTSLLGIMISEPVDGGNSSSSSNNNNNNNNRTFVTATTTTSSSFSFSSSSSSSSSPRYHLGIPPNRPIQVYAYGPPATVCSALRDATRGLITTMVNGNDIVPFLSLGLLHDVQGAALALRADGAAREARRRILKAIARACLARDDQDVRNDGDDEWGYELLGTLRRAMRSEKLVPPGEVFVVEGTVALLRAPETTEGGKEGVGRPAKRMVLRYVKDVERRFGEIRFGMGLLTDHSPARYEAALDRLVRGLGVKE